MGLTRSERISQFLPPIMRVGEKYMQIEERLRALGLSLPEPVALPATVRLPFAQVRIHGNRAYISGHGPQALDGSLAPPFGKVGAEVSLEEGYEAARLT